MDRYREDRFYDPRMQDPEYAWKHRDSLRLQTLAENFRQAPSSRGGNEGTDWTGRSFGGGFRRKVIFCAVLFALLWIMHQIEHPWAEKGKKWVAAALTEDWDSSKAAVWYESMFAGSPSFIPSFLNKKEPSAQKASGNLSSQFVSPVSGKPSKPFAAGDSGVVLLTAPNTAVYAIGTGRIIQISRAEDQGAMVVIQHARGYQSVYGGLQETMLKRNDWINRGERIGSTWNAQSGGNVRMFFALKKDDQWINPLEVVSFD